MALHKTATNKKQGESQTALPLSVVRYFRFCAVFILALRLLAYNRERTA